jgi:hypothetical protein
VANTEGELTSIEEAAEGQIPNDSRERMPRLMLMLTEIRCEGAKFVGLEVFL